ncbi:MAG TPA: hypothetical protein VE398_24760, partial [Acidobacteriota bacterium]|nr:hypothetical protein [Acidobacteriota bacterium]
MTSTAVRMPMFIAYALCFALVAALPPASSAEDERASDHKRAQSESAGLPTGLDNGDIVELKKQIAEQQRQLLDQRRQLLEQGQRLEELRLMLLELRKTGAEFKADLQKPTAASSQAPSATQGLGQIASLTAMLPPTSPAAPEAFFLRTQTKEEGQDVSPVQFRLGSAYFTPVGFMDFTAVFRDTDPGSNIGTNFGSFPYRTAANVAGNMTEFRLSPQNSRLGMRVDARVKGANVLGYWESDFLGGTGNPPVGNISVSSNSYPFRLRLYWVDVRKGKFEFLGGQTWSLITPGRKGISPLPGDLFYTQDIDVNYQLGLTW